VFGLLVAGEHGYLAFLLSVTWWAVLPALLGVLAVAGSVLVWLGRGRGWLAVTVSAALLVLGLVLVAIVFGVFGGGAALAEALLLLLGPVGALALATRPPVRAWTTRRARRA
jgi:hypothetical protein